MTLLAFFEILDTPRIIGLLHWNNAPKRKNYYGNDTTTSRAQWSNNGAEARIALSVIYLFTPPRVAIDYVMLRPQTRESTDRWTVVVLIKIVRELACDLFKCLRMALCMCVCA